VARPLPSHTRFSAHKYSLPSSLFPTGNTHFLALFRPDRISEAYEIIGAGNPDLSPESETSALYGGQRNSSWPARASRKSGVVNRCELSPSILPSSLTSAIPGEWVICCIVMGTIAEELNKRFEERFHVLSLALRSFAEATTDYEYLLDVVARTLGSNDGCVVRLLSDGGWLSTVATHLPLGRHIQDADAIAFVRAHVAASHNLSEHAGLRRVIETGEAVLVPHVDLEKLRATATPQMVRVYETVGIHSHLLVALRLRGKSIGSIALLRFDPALPCFDEGDRDMAQALSDHAALAIENARSYAAEREARASAERAKEDSHASEVRYRLMFENSPLPKWMYDMETLRFLDVNDAAARNYGYSREEYLAMTIVDIHPPEDVPSLLNSVHTVSPQPKFRISKHRKKSGEVFPVEVTVHGFSLGGRACGLAVGRDITERLRLEEQLRQLQKMEAVGRLAGGVAHDFNNILSVILSYGETLLAEIRPGDPMRGDVEEIRKAAERASELTRQLLMFSRQQVLDPKVLDLNELLAGMAKMLGRLVGEDVELVSTPGASIGKVRVDPGSIELVIMNLVVNARDAMPTGGRITIETANADLDETFVQGHLVMKPGRHVLLAVSDTGTGMDKATLSRIFEPFFTTKEKGKGTGLGLSAVFGIVQRSGGSVWVYSELGKGTTVKVYLPLAEGEVDVVRPAIAPPSLRGSETILLVEDEDQVRVVVRGILKRQGYHVIELQNGGEALLFCEKYSNTIDLLLTDVVMPRMGGPELARRLATLRPTMKILFMSGYTDDAVVRHGALDAGIAFIQKPLTPGTLARKVREVLDAERQSRP